MKRLQQLFGATTLLVVLSVSTLAGEIHTNAVPPPPPPPASATASEPSEMSTGATESTVEPDTLITEITFSILQLLSVF
jgi:hypothetical protein